MAKSVIFTTDWGNSRKPPVSAQFNWISGGYEVVPEQLDLDMPAPDGAILPDDSTVTLLATENGAQLLVAGFGLYIGKKRERIVVKKAGKICAQGIRVGCMTSSRRPGGADHIAAADGDGRNAAAAAQSVYSKKGARNER
jgi:hypothetical protein